MQMRFNKTIIKILLIIMVAIVGLVYPTTSSAWSSRSFPTSFGMDRKGPNSHKLANTHGLYCIQRKAHLKSIHKNNYHLSAKITIVGNTATYRKNGKTKTTTNEYNGTMSYIFSGGKWPKKYGSSAGNYTSRQVAIYKYWNTWVKHSGLGLGHYSCRSNDHMGTNKTVNKILSAAKKYASSSAVKNGPASVKASKKQIKVKETTIGKIIGPFKFTYSGNTTLKVLDSKGKKISKVDFYDGDTDKAKKISKIESGKEFYIKNNSKTEIEGVKLEAKSNLKSTTIYILSNSHERQRLAAVNSSSKNQSDDATIKVIIKKKNKDLGELLVKKTDKNTSSKLKGMKFKIKTAKGENTWLQYLGNNKYKYDATYKDATTYKIEEVDGKEIMSLSLKEKYQVWETKTPSSKYVLEKQPNYSSDLKAANLTGKNSWIKLSKDKTQNVTYSNIPKDTTYISISGMVWEDIKQTKANVYDNLYNKETEQALDGVTVRLMRKGNSATEVASTKTVDGGKYVFSNKIPEGSISNYYVEFMYSTEYMPVEFNSAEPKDIKTNGSRAMAVNGKDGVATTYAGTSSEMEKKYGLSGNLYKNDTNTGLYNASNKTLENINLGLKKALYGTKNVDQNIAYVKIKIKGYEYTYEYGGTEDKNKIAAPVVSFQSKNRIAAYTREFYPSDVSYTKLNNNKDKIQVYVGYRIDIKNETTTSTHEYTEIKMHVTSLTDKFDTNRYELHDNRWTAIGDTATLKDEHLKDIKDGGILPSEVKTKYIEFSVKDDAILKMLEHPEGIIEENPTDAIAESYHEYKTYGTKIINDEPVTGWWGPYTTGKQTKHLTAPYLIFKLGEQREIKGKVFEDKVVTTNGEKQGNGIYENGENVARNVKVDLLDIDKDENDITKAAVSDLYNVKALDDGSKKATSSKASVLTDTNGNFTLTGMVPGYYYLRFTYGDGTQKIYNVAENKEVDLSSKNYKSTIVTSENAKDALKNGKNVEWYKVLEGTNYSVAVDNLDTRKVANSSDNAQNVNALTAKASITVENTKNDKANVSIAENGEQTENTKRTYEGFNLGLVAQPKREALVEKMITNVKLENGQHEIIFEGNPESTKMKGVMDLELDKKTKKGGSTYVRIERDENIIYGSTLTITYAIKVTNISDVNYYNEWYYWFGEKDENKEITLKVNEVMDYLDETLKYKSCDEKHKVEVTTDFIGGNTVDGVDVKKQYKIKVTGWKTLYTVNNKERKQDKQQKVATSDTAYLVTTRELSQQDADIEILNDAEIEKGKIINYVDDLQDNDKDKKSNDADYPTVAELQVIKTSPKEVQANKANTTKVIITPPTGEDKNSIILYTIVGAITLAILSAGVVIIKKRII